MAVPLAALVLAGCGAASGGGSGGGGRAAASCVGPYLDDQPPGAAVRGAAAPATVAPGATVTIHGHWYTSTCNDTGGHDPLKPLPPVRLTLTLPGGQVQQLGEFTPGGPDLGFSSPVQIPAGAARGTATVADDRDPQASYAFQVLPTP